MISPSVKHPANDFSAAASALSKALIAASSAVTLARASMNWIVWAVLKTSSAAAETVCESVTADDEKQLANGQTVVVTHATLRTFRSELSSQSIPFGALAPAYKDAK